MNMLLPATILVAHTFLIGGVALVRRVREIRERQIPLRYLARAADVLTLLRDSAAMDNFNNLLQVPMLFYVLCLTMGQAGIAGTGYVLGAWSYVFLRLVHSFIQVVGNNVKRRFLAWAFSNGVLCLLWLAFAAQALSIFRQGG